jgi:hypothetical protein
MFSNVLQPISNTLVMAGPVVVLVVVLILVGLLVVNGHVMVQPVMVQHVLEPAMDILVMERAI